MEQKSKDVADPRADQPQAVERFLEFMEAGDVTEILKCFTDVCREVGLEKEQRTQEDFYSKLKQQLPHYHRSSSLFKILDQRAALKEYNQQSACRGARVLVVGAGPVGLRAAVEVALLGAKVDLVEKRTSFTRNNVLHLWSFLVHDLKSLGIKKFVGQFGTGGIDHISILKLQCFLLKVCLLLGVRYHSQVTFDSLQEPKTSSNSGWTVKVTPSSCPVTGQIYDAILAADGKKRSLPGFPADVFRANLAIGITANFTFHGTAEEAAADEIAGVASHFHPGFFKSLKEKHKIHLENIVYYRDKTHYFVMTAKRDSLFTRGVLKQNVTGGVKALLASSNIDHQALERYAVDAATFATKGQLGKLEFVKTQQGTHDVSIFDFTALSKAKHAARIVERKNQKILLCIAGDSLNEPFWPTGSGIAHGFLGAFDAAWMLKRYREGVPPMELIEEREALFHVLTSTSNDKMAKGDQFTIDPRTRYPHYSNLPIPPSDVSHLYDSDTKPAAPTPRPASAGKQETHRIKIPEKPKRNHSFTPHDRDNYPTYKELQNHFKQHAGRHYRAAPPRPKPATTHQQQPPPQAAAAAATPTPEISIQKDEETQEKKAASPGLLKKFTKFLSGLFKKSPTTPRRSPQPPQPVKDDKETKPVSATPKTTERPTSGRVHDRIQLFSTSEQRSTEGSTSDATVIVPKGLVAGRMQALRKAHEDTDSGTVQFDGDDEDGMSEAELEQLVNYFVDEFEPPQNVNLAVQQKRPKDDIQISQCLPSKEVTSWQMRFTGCLNKSLTNLRAQNDLLTVKRTLSILNVIYSNIQTHPGDYQYQCIRLTGTQFAKHVWCFPDAQLFLLQSGWIEIDKYLSLPFELNLDIPMEILSRHTYIVDQLLWSRDRGGREECDMSTAELVVTSELIGQQTNRNSFYDSPEPSDNEEEGDQADRHES